MTYERAKPYTYAKLHPIALCVALGSIILGLFLALDPTAASVSPTLGVLTEGGVRVWGLFFTVGGLASSWAILRGLAPLEAFGMALMSPAYGCALVPPFLDPTLTRSPLLIVFVTLAVGTGLRALGLATQRIY